MIQSKKIEGCAQNANLADLLNLLIVKMMLKEMTLIILIRQNLLLTLNRLFVAAEKERKLPSMSDSTIAGQVRKKISLGAVLLFKNASQAILLLHMCLMCTVP